MGAAGLDAPELHLDAKGCERYLGASMACRLFVASTAVVVALLTATAARSAQPLVTGIIDPEVYSGLGTGDLARAYGRAAAAGATVVRLDMDWASVAPATRRTEFRPNDPDDPSYDWRVPDARIASALEHGFTPIVAIRGTPKWAALVDSPVSAPNPADYGAFARAAARRYSGASPGRPHVKYWQAWIEPNLSIFFQPQFNGRQPVSPGIYRRMVNAFAAGVHAASPLNLVVAGGTAPFRDITPDIQKVAKDWGPLTFMRQLLCLSPALKPTCSTPVTFDVWDHHPYTSGGPSHHAAFPDDVSLGDLPKMRATLQAAERARHIVSRGPVRFWVTEFSWDSSPPDPKGVPMGLLTRWVADGLYTMWRNGISLVTWLQLRDDPVTTSFIQSGLYFRGASFASDRPKPLLRAFRFPFVAYPRTGGIAVWGRTPAGRPGSVAVEARVGARWRTLARLRTDGNGIFRTTTPSPRADLVRARFVSTNQQSASFALKAPPDRFFNPFGQPTLLEPRKKGQR